MLMLGVAVIAFRHSGARIGGGTLLLLLLLRMLMSVMIIGVDVVCPGALKSDVHILYGDRNGIKECLEDTSSEE